MENITKPRNSMTHPTIDWAEPYLYFIQSPLCHIPSMNVGLATKQPRIPQDLP